MPILLRVSDPKICRQGGFSGITNNNNPNFCGKVKVSFGNWRSNKVSHPSQKGWQHYRRLFWENLVYLITSVFYSILLCVNIKNISNDTLQRIHVVEFQYCLKVPNSWYFLVAVRVKTSKIKRVYQRFG